MFPSGAKEGELPVRLCDPRTWARDQSVSAASCPLLTVLLSLSVWSGYPSFRLGIAEGLNSGTELGLWRPGLEPVGYCLFQVGYSYLLPL